MSNTPNHDALLEIKAELEYEKIKADLERYKVENAARIARMEGLPDPNAPAEPSPTAHLDNIAPGDFLARELAHARYMAGDDLSPPKPTEPRPEPQDGISQTILRALRARGQIK